MTGAEVTTLVHDARPAVSASEPRGAKSAPRRRRRSRRGLYLSYAMIATPLIMLIVFGVYPFLQGVARAFYDYNGGTIDRWVGLANFVKIASDASFWHAVGNGLLLMAVSLAATTLVPLWAAWLVHHFTSVRLKYAFRTLVMLPVIVPGAVLFLVWQQILKPQGAFNQVLGLVGLEGLQRFWLDDPNVVLIGLMIVGLPWLAGINTLLILGGFANVPRELYEAAQLDGATRRTVFFRVEAPFVAMPLRIILTLGIINGLQSYESVFILTQGGPLDASMVPGILLYRAAFSYGQYGYASAIGLTIMIITLAILAVATILRKALLRG